MPELFSGGAFNRTLFHIIRGRLGWHSNFETYQTGEYEMDQFRAEYERFRSETPSQRLWGPAGEPEFVRPPQIDINETLRQLIAEGESSGQEE